MLRLIRLMLVSAAMFSLAAASSLLAGETLYNGIELANDWPPDIRTLTNDPMPVPYLESPGNLLLVHDVAGNLWCFAGASDQARAK